MMKRVFRITCGTALVPVLVLAAGCGGGGPSGSQTDDMFIGTWLEDRSAAAAPEGRRQASVEPTSSNIRQITFAADHTFKLIVCKPDGSPVAGAKDATGTWKVENGILMLEVTQNKLTGKYKLWDPDAFNDLIDGADGAQRLELLHKSGETVQYKRSGG